MTAAEQARIAIKNAGGLATPRELAEEWKMSEQAMSQRIHRGAFPEPVKIAGRVRLYLRQEVAAYMVNELLDARRSDWRRGAEFARRAIANAGEGEDVEAIREQLAEYERALEAIGRS